MKARNPFLTMQSKQEQQLCQIQGQKLIKEVTARTRVYIHNVRSIIDYDDYTFWNKEETLIFKIIPFSIQFGEVIAQLNLEAFGKKYPSQHCLSNLKSPWNVLYPPTYFGNILPKKLNKHLQVRGKVQERRNNPESSTKCDM